MEYKRFGFILLALTTIAGVLFNFQTRNTEQELFDEWKGKLGLSFKADELAFRFNVFKENLNKINTHNSKLSKGHEEELNHFAFLTEEEFRAQYLSQYNAPSHGVVVE